METGRVQTRHESITVLYLYRPNGIYKSVGQTDAKTVFLHLFDPQVYINSGKHSTPWVKGNKTWQH